MLEVYLDPCTVNSRKVLAGLDLLGTQYHFNHVDYFAGAHKSPDYSKINPNKTVPCAVDDDCTITESNSISKDRYYPEDLKKRADINRWLLWEGSVWFQSCYVYLVVKLILKTEPDESVIAEQAPRWNQLASIIDDQLAEDPRRC